MAIAALTTYASDTNSSSTTTNTSSTYNLDADDFMTLLLTQLENQDPTDPMDMDAFTSQLCSLNQLQQSVQTNAHLEEILSEISSGSSSNAVAYIGKSIIVDGAGVSVSGGSACNMVFDLEGDASLASITVYDPDGNAVKTLELSDLSSGGNSVEWDGTGDDGETLEDGTYNYTITAYNSDSETINATMYSNLLVTGVAYDDGTPFLIAGGQEISLDNVTGVNQS